jgi:hypothetical protein
MDFVEGEEKMRSDIDTKFLAKRMPTGSVMAARFNTALEVIR